MGQEASYCFYGEIYLWQHTHKQGMCMYGQVHLMIAVSCKEIGKHAIHLLCVYCLTAVPK